MTRTPPAPLVPSEAHGGCVAGRGGGRDIERIDRRGDDLLAFLPDLVEAETVTGHEKPGQEVVIDAADWPAIVPGTVTMQGRIG